MKTLLALMLLTGSAQAATTISTTLTMTSPSAVISMTGVSSTAYFANISATNIGTSASNISGTGPGLLFASVVISSSSSTCQVMAGFNVSGCQHIATGVYGVSFTVPRPNVNYFPICNGRGAGTNLSWGSARSDLVPTTAGFYFGVANISGGSTNFVDSPVAACLVPN